ncbi:MAG TPA: S-layer homology domain-containing protein [Chloroflexia bacterium]|nr:S-layer homology domain-containing protein [Chloroflexia bacterium]
MPTRPPVRWEVTVLQALADAHSWPTGVTEGPGGKLSVQLEASAQEMYQASIRPFETEAGAGAAFSAEMEDLRLAGLRVTPTLFFSYPAYVATMTNGAGVTVERQFVLQAGDWIMGVVVRGVTGTAQAFNPQTAAQHLLYLSVQQGLPSPPGGVTPPAPQSGAPTAAPTPCGVTFSDVPASHWAGGFISRLACDGIVSGYADGTFRPQNPTTRAQLTKMLALVEGWELASPTVATFADVPPSHIFFRYVETAVRKEVVSGYADGYFRPDAYVTRAQVAKMLVQARGWTFDSESTVTLCDVPRPHWAWRPIQIAIAHGAFEGYADGCFYPNSVATRAQLAKLLVNATH